MLRLVERFAERFVILGLLGGAVAVGLVGGARAWAAPGGFTFATPPGWLNISRDAPESDRRKAPPAFQAQIESGAFEFQAIDLAHVGHFLTNVNAAVTTAAKIPRLTPARLEELQRAARDQATQQGFSYSASQKGLVEIGGVTAGRLVAELRRGPLVAKSVLYVIPGDHALAFLTFSTAPDLFASYEPTFDAAALATRGAVEPASAADGASERLGAILGGVAGAVGAALGIRALKKKKKAARAPNVSAPR